MNKMPPSLILVGGKPSQVQKMKAIASGENWKTKHVPHVGRDFPENNQACQDSALAVLFYQNTLEKTQEQFHSIKHHLPHIPVVVVGKPPTRLEIIQIFRMGAKDFILWPLENKETLRLFDHYKAGRENGCSSARCNVC